MDSCFIARVDDALNVLKDKWAELEFSVLTLMSSGRFPGADGHLIAASRSAIMAIQPDGSPDYKRLYARGYRLKQGENGYIVAQPLWSSELFSRRWLERHDSPHEAILASLNSLANRVSGSLAWTPWQPSLFPEIYLRFEPGTLDVSGLEEEVIRNADGTLYVPEGLVQEEARLVSSGVFLKPQATAYMDGTDLFLHTEYTEGKAILFSLSTLGEEAAVSPEDLEGLPQAMGPLIVRADRLGWRSANAPLQLKVGNTAFDFSFAAFQRFKEQSLV